ncbi:MAG: DUF4261 domain-containing protein [Lentisphaeraceae bacterium]|nr:DUF4261 domain-containing protein [Lentisphaeraceae bacterium]
MIEDSKDEDVFAKTYGVELLFAEEPKIDIKAAIKTLGNHCGPVDHQENEQQHIMFMLAHEVEFEDGKKVPAQLILVKADASDTHALEAEVEQSWQTDNAQELVNKTKYKVLLSDLMTDELPYKQRLEIFSQALKAILTNSNCIAVASTRTQQILEPQALINSPDPLFGYLNVRFFNTGDGNFLMDTLGLKALGLYDLQCHFKNIPPQQMSTHLFNVAYYIFNENPQIDNGHTLEGLANDEWEVNFEVSTVPPSRSVLQLNPGKAFAAD